MHAEDVGNRRRSPARKRNNKGRPAGAGTVSHKRRLAYQDKCRRRDEAAAKAKAAASAEDNGGGKDTPASSSSSSSLQRTHTLAKGVEEEEAKTLPLTEGLKLWQPVQPDNVAMKTVCVDWHQTFEVTVIHRDPLTKRITKKSEVPLENIRAAKSLQHAGFKLCLLSFCGYDREMQTRANLEALRKGPEPFTFDKVMFVRSVCGPTGKACTARMLGARHMVDDRRDVLQEAEGFGIKPWPIRTESQWHSWATLSCSTFAEAARLLLKQ